MLTKIKFGKFTAFEKLAINFSPAINISVAENGIMANFQQGQLHNVTSTLHRLIAENIHRLSAVKLS